MTTFLSDDYLIRGYSPEIKACMQRVWSVPPATASHREKWRRQVCLARHFGFKVQASVKKPKMCFDGRIARIGKPFMRGQSRMIILPIHELCHWLVAGNERRRVPEYGLNGHWMLSRVTHNKHEITKINPMKEEEMATALGVVIAADLGVWGSETLSGVGRDFFGDGMRDLQHAGILTTEIKLSPKVLRMAKNVKRIKEIIPHLV